MLVYHQYFCGVFGYQQPSQGIVCLAKTKHCLYIDKTINKNKILLYDQIQ